MRYWYPFTEEVLDQIQKDGVNTLVIVPLYPQFSVSTSGSSLRVLQEIFYKNPERWGSNKVRHTVVPAWYFRTGYVRAMAQLIVEEFSHFSASERAQGVHILFSAHGVPQSYVQAGDPYQRHVEEGVRLIAMEIKKLLEERKPSDSTAQTQSAGSPDPGDCLRLHLSFQSRVGPVQWLRPYTEDTLVDLGKSGVKNLIVVPISFVSEHVETLEEIDMEYRVPALNMDTTFITDMADLVVESLHSPAVSVMEAASQTIAEMDQSPVESTLRLSK
eukprot:gene2155-2575_t